MSSRLTSESRIYADKAKDLNRQVSYICLLSSLSFNLFALTLQGSMHGSKSQYRYWLMIFSIDIINIGYIGTNIGFTWRISYLVSQNPI